MEQEFDEDNKRSDLVLVEFHNDIAYKLLQFENIKVLEFLTKSYVCLLLLTGVRFRPDQKRISLSESRVFRRTEQSTFIGTNSNGNSITYDLSNIDHHVF